MLHRSPFTRLRTQASFVSFDHARSPDFFSQATSFGTIFFSSDENIGYDASGFYDAVDSEGRTLRLLAKLTNVTTSGLVFNMDQQSNATANESFTLGDSGGDLVNTTVGSLSGVLLAGQNYRFDFTALLQASPTASTSSATAAGSLTLNFTANPPPIPEPGTALLTGLGLVVLTTKRRMGRLSATRLG